MAHDPQFRGTNSVAEWLEETRVNDGADGLWRVHDSLYDLTPFIARHPGGTFWIEQTRGVYTWCL